MKILSRRRLPIGSELVAPDKPHFRAWAPEADRMDVAIEASADHKRPQWPPREMRREQNVPNEYG